MLVSRFLPAAAMALFSVAAIAQQAPPTPPAPAEPAPAARPHDCTFPVARHDHGAERGSPAPRMTGCAMAQPTPSEAKKAHARPGHDHARVHKLM